MSPLLAPGLRPQSRASSSALAIATATYCRRDIPRVGQATGAAVDQRDMPSLRDPHPFWTIETARPRGLFFRRRRTLLMVAQTRPECVGWWLAEYLENNPSDHTFSALRVLGS
jgi:hypothetical protein